MVFIVDGRLVIGMIVRIDMVDNFWFILMYEFVYVMFYFFIGLVVGFYD